VKVNWKVLPVEEPGQGAPTPLRHPLSKLAGSELAAVAVWNAESWLVHTTVLFLPITTVTLSGVYPYRVELPELYPEYGALAPAVMLTNTQAEGVEAQFTALEVVVLVGVVVCLAATSNW
jgi:hypothetical protein